MATEQVNKETGELASTYQKRLEANVALNALQLTLMDMFSEEREQAELQFKVVMKLQTLGMNKKDAIRLGHQAALNWLNSLGT